ncbi:MAG: large conductance mechanosensitive channel protein MscL [Solobacterium sp.]|jgi:large conductance mechanosensitive channel|nr:large conductance mechanosensitive channel protein MscL [Solobacterium sp.]
MKKFLEEFKAFALKGNVMDMSIGVIIGAAFGNIVTSLTDNFINPLIQVCTGGMGEDGVAIGGSFKIAGVSFNYGAFLSAVINFIIMAFILFCLLKAINKAMSIGKKKEEAKPAEDPADVKLLKELVAIVKEQNPEAAKAAEEKLAAK